VGKRPLQPHGDIVQSLRVVQESYHPPDQLSVHITPIDRRSERVVPQAEHCRTVRGRIAEQADSGGHLVDTSPHLCRAVLVQSCHSSRQPGTDPPQQHVADLLQSRRVRLPHIAVALGPRQCR
jgi:hypothetical protein